VTKTVASKISAPTGQATPRDPKTRSSRTLVRVKSGDTLVVGGLIDRTDEHSLRKVPVLGGIPVLGEAFKNTEVSDTASELIVFVTPQILDETKMARVASSSQAPMGAREQEPAGARQDAIEQSLNVLEQEPL
jgi:type II secretory pathway component GspD/PulD (secretin)